jgi:hypothetical protein
MKITSNGPQSIGQMAKHFSYGNLYLSPDEYQRENAWDISQKKLLVDTVFRGMDIPKFYLWKIDEKTLRGGYPLGTINELYRRRLDEKRKNNDEADPYLFEVVDGQQRLRTLLEFMGQKPPSKEVYRGAWLEPFQSLAETPQAKGRLYSALNPDQQNSFEQCSLSVMVLEDATIDEIRDMFLRLQNGTPLTAQQKRDAMGSDVGAQAKALSALPFFTKSVAFPSLAADYHRVASQMLLLEYRDRISMCTSQRLDRFYKDHIATKLEAAVVGRVRKILGLLGRIFPVQCHHINRSYALGLYWALSRLSQTYSFADSELPKIKANFEVLDVRRMEAAERGYVGEPDDEDLKELSRSMSHGTDGSEMIETRHDILTQFIFEGVRLTPLPELDPQRAFTNEEKLILYQRAGGKCQLSCDGRICARAIPFDEAAIDHLVPHSKGGKTELANGRYASRSCNIARGVRDDFDPEKECCRLGGTDSTGTTA